MSSKKSKTVKNNINKTNPKNRSDHKKAEITKSAKQHSKKSLDKKALRLYILSFLVPFIVAIVGLVMGGFAPFGSKDIMTASGHESMVPFYHELYDRFHNGTVLAYNYNNGYDFSKVFLYYMSDSLNLVMLILPKSAMFGCMSVLYAIKIGLSGLFASIFFKYRKAIALFNKVEMEDERADEIAEYESKLKAKRDKAREKNKNKKDFKIGGSEAPKTKFGTWLANLDIYTFVLAVSYALSSYMITEGANIAYTGAVALFPLVLLGIERLIAEKHWLTYVIAFTLTLYANIYIAMIEFVFMLIYVPTRDYHSLKEGIEICLRKIVLDILVVGAGFVVVLNAFTSSVFHTDFSLSFPAYNPMANIADSFSEMMYGSLPSTVNSFVNNADLYASVLILFLLALYIFNSNVNVYSRIKNIIILFLLFIGTVFPTANHFLNICKDTSYFYTTFGFLFIIMLLIVGQDTLENIEHAKSWQVLLSFAIVIGITVYSMTSCTSYEGPNAYLYTMELVSLYFIITIMWKNNSMTRLVFDTAIGLIVIAEICMAFPKSFSQVGISADEYSSTLTAKIENATNHIIDKFDSNRESRIIYYESNRTNIEPVSEMLLGIKYVVTKEETENMDFNLTKIDSVDGIDIYENEYCLEGGVKLRGIPEGLLQNYISDPYDSINELVDSILVDVAHEEVYQPIPLLPEEIINSGYELYNKDGTIVNDETLNVYKLGAGHRGDLYGHTRYIVHAGEVSPFNEVFIEQKLLSKEDDIQIYNQSYYALNRNSYLILFNTLSDDIYKNATSISLSPIVSSTNIHYNNANVIDRITIWDNDYDIVYNESSKLEYSYPVFYPVILLTTTILFILVIIALYRNRNNSSLPLKKLKLIQIEALSNFIFRYRAYIINITFTTIIFILFLMITRVIPFGEKTALVSDGYAAYYPSLASTYIGLPSRLSDLRMESIGFSSLLFSAGKLGLESLFNILNWPLMLFSNESAISGVTFIFFIRFLLTGPTMIFYLTHRHRRRLQLTDPRLIPASIAYSICSFYTGYFVFYVFFDIALAMPFAILVLEGLLYKNDIKKYVIIMSLIMFFNMFQAFQLCEFILLYFFTFKFDSIKDFLQKGIKFAFASILSAMIAAYSLYPLFVTLQNSAYLLKGGISATDIIESSSSATSNVPSFNLHNTLIKSFKDLMVMCSTNQTDADFTKANSYAGILILFFVVAFLFNKKIHIYERISKAILVFILYFSYGNRFLNFIMHGFHKQTMVPNRFAYIIIFLAIVMFVDSYNVYNTIKSKKAVLILAITTLSIIVLSIFSFYSEGLSPLNISVILTICFTLTYFSLLCYRTVSKKSKKSVANRLLMILLITELVITNIYNVPGKFSTYIPPIESANRYITRIAKNQEYNKNIDRVESYSTGPKYELVNNGIKTSTYSVSGFSSTITASYLNAFYATNILSYKNNIQYNNGNILADEFLNVKAIAYDPFVCSDQVPIYMNKAAQSGRVTMYESPYSLAIGFNIPDKISISDLNIKTSKNVCDYHNSIFNRITNKDIYTLYKLHRQAKNTDDSNNTDSQITWKLANTSYIYENSYLKENNYFEYSVNHDRLGFRSITSNNTIITIHIPKEISGDIYIGNRRFIRYIASCDENNTLDIDLPFAYYVIPGKTEMECMEEQLQLYDIAVLNEGTLSDFYKTLKDGCIKNINVEGTTISGDINITEPGTIYFSLPKLDGFSAYIDGKRVDTVEYFGALGVPATDTGEHHIELRYKVDGFTEGIIISLSGIVIFIIVLTIQRKLSKQKDKNRK